MRRTIALLTAMAMTLLVATSVAMAATSQLHISCPVPTNPNILCLGTFNDDTMIGTDATYGDCVEPVGCWGDKIYGLGGNDTLKGRGGGDILNGGPGNDKLDGGERKDYFYGVSGNDSINTADKQADNRISCGDGYDTVRYDRYLDVPDGDCEAKIGVVWH